MNENFKIRDNLEKFVLDVLKEENISPYELSRKTGCNETLWKNFLDGRTKMPDSGAIVALADYKKVSLDKIVGRDITKEIEIKTSKEVKPKIPVFMTELSSEALQSAMHVREEIGKFRHKSTLNSTEQKEFFADKERARRSKPTERTR